MVMRCNKYFAIVEPVNPHAHYAFDLLLHCLGEGYIHNMAKIDANNLPKLLEYLHNRAKDLSNKLIK
ncbi:MAG: hypothetical protein J7K26_02760 [Candidatus Aenigmarchaeota archaeon]|nr:hypothetical protein [Candidatus Aenigmarchaeota archaeon]